MKRILAIIAIMCSSVLLSAQGSYNLYIRQYAEIAVGEMHRSGVPASITLAQGLLESAAGQSVLARMGNNHFGIKCAGSWTGQTIFHDDDKKGECFRKYSNAKDSYKDHSDFLRYSKRYQSLFDLPVTDYKAWAYGLKAAGYATDPSYAAKIIGIIEDYKLYTFDTDGKPQKAEAKPQTSGAAASEQPVATIPESPNQLQQVHKSNFQFSLSRPVYEINGVPFVTAMEGESIESIANDFSLFRKELMKFNDLSGNVVLRPGERVFIKAKKSKALKGLEKHVVESDNETVRDIAQQYGVTVKALEKLNKNMNLHILREGDIISIR